MPQISVLMLAYNTEKYVGKAIESILSQTFQDFELIVYNDGSTDNTKETVLSILDPRIRFIDNERNLGLSHARKASLNEAKGKYVAVLDSDDIAFPTRLELQFTFMERHPNIALCGANALLIDTDGRNKGELLHRRKFKKEDTKSAFFFQNIFVNSSTIFRREVAQQVGGYNDMAPVEDYDLFVRISDLHDIFVFNDPLVYYRIHENNISQKSHDLAVGRLKEIKKYQLGLLGVDADKYGSLFNALLWGDFEKFSLNDFFTFLIILKRTNIGQEKFDSFSFEKRLYQYWYNVVINKLGKQNALKYLLNKELFSLRYVSLGQLVMIGKLSIKKM